MSMYKDPFLGQRTWCGVSVKWPTFQYILQTGVYMSDGRVKPLKRPECLTMFSRDVTLDIDSRLGCFSHR